MIVYKIYVFNFLIYNNFNIRLLIFKIKKIKKNNRKLDKFTIYNFSLYIIKKNSLL